MHYPLTPDELAELIYTSYARQSEQYDYRLRPFARLSWEQSPSYTKSLLRLVAIDIINALNDLSD